MKVSVILPLTTSYKKYHKDAAGSIKNQTIDVKAIALDTSDYNVAEATNKAAKQANTEYIMRLDCDDMLHPMCCEIMSNFLDKDSYFDAVHSDYFEMDEHGSVGKVIEQNYIPHPGCMMIRKSVFDEIGGFNENLERQEGTDFWYRLTKNHKVGHIRLPLWYYRRHDQQMSNAHNEVVKARHEVKENHKVQAEKILAIIPARGGSKGIPRKNLVMLNGLPLVSHAIRMAKSSRHDLLIYVSTEDEEIEQVALKEGVSVLHRDPKDAEDDVNLITVAKHCMEQCDPDFRADIIITIQPTAPHTPVSALDNALDRILANPELSSVVSMTEVIGKHPYRMYEKNNLYKHIFYPLFPTSEKYLQRQKRPKVYCFTGGFYIRRRHLLENWKGDDFALGNWEGELVPPKAGIDIDTKFDLWLAEALFNHQEEL